MCAKGKDSNQRMGRICIYVYDASKFPSTAIRRDYSQAGESTAGPPKLATGAPDNPNFKDFIYRDDSSAIQTQNALAKLGAIQEAPHTSISEENSI